MKIISSSDREKITRLVLALVPQAAIYLFGSRARGTNSPVSDVDIAVDAGVPLSRVVIDEAQSIMSASNLIYHVDVVDMNRISDEMRDIIMSEGIVWAN